jgi:hypothetical protein
MCNFGVMNPKFNVISSHMYCSNNYQSISLSKNCACIYCKQTPPKDAVTDWVETEKEKTAICPFCGIDAVIGGIQYSDHRQRIY